jgi:hypothetical protein
LVHQVKNFAKSNDVTSFFAKHKPEVVIDAAAKVGGILANNNIRISL